MARNSGDNGFDAARGWRLVRFMFTSRQGLCVVAVSIALAVLAPSPIKLLPLFLGLGVIFGMARKRGMLN
jgi:hypothetical protein